MIYNTRDVGLCSKWTCDEYGVIEVTSYDPETLCFVSEKGFYGEYDLIEFIQLCRPYKDSDTKSFKLSDSGKKVSDLLNDDVVIVIATDGAYKGGHTAKVRYELADFMDDEPPFIEVSFVDANRDTIYSTDDLTQPVYEIDGLLIIKTKGK